MKLFPAQLHSSRMQFSFSPLSYRFFNFSLNLQTPWVNFQLNVYNLFDTDYVSSINKSGYRYHPGEPRTFLLTANMHF